MKDAVIILLCAVALANSFDQNLDSKLRSCNCNPNEAQQICEANYDNDNVLIAHENCDKFYKCSSGKPVAYHCPDNLLYNPFAEICDWPHNVDCGDRPISEGTGSDTGSEGNDNNSDENEVDTGSCNCNPDEAPSLCAAEGSNGILVAHQNCNQFYKCAEGKPVTFDCPPSLLYDPYLERCDWPQNVECGDRVIQEPDNDANDSTNDGNNGNDGTCNCNPEEAPSICAAPDSGGVLVAHEHCDKYYICNHGSPEVVSCPDGLLFNPYTKQCDWPRDVECGDRLVPETDCVGCNDNGNDDASDCDGNDNVLPPGDDDSSESSDFDAQPPQGDDDGVIPPGDDGTCNCNPEEAPSICANDDSDGILVAHENCNQFYKCDHGKPAVLSCPGNLLYNPYTEKCDWPENVDCGDRPITDPENDGDNNNSGGNNDGGNEGGSNEGGGNEGGGNEGGGNCDPNEAPTICAADDSDGILVAHENCNQFYKCFEGKPVAMSCPGNLLFNPTTDQCDWPHNVDCGDRVIPDPEDSNNESSDDSGDLPPGGDDVVRPPVDDGTCNCNPEEAPSICAGDNSDGTLVAHENCNQFYKCDHGKPVVLSCPGNLLYNPYTEQCDWPENVDCGDRGISEPENDDNDNTSGGNNDGGNGGGGNEGGGNEGAGNEGGGNCDPSEAPTICAGDNSEGVLVAHENCNQFYICNGGKPVAMSCPENLLFNPNTDQCDWPHNVECGDRVIPDPEDSNNESGDDSGNDVVRPPVDDGTCNCNPEEAPSICAGEDSSGTLVAHENCNQFYKCDHGKPVVLSCPGNLLYNPYTERCDWPENVDCGDRGISDPENDDNDNTSGGNNDGGNEGGGNEGGGNEGGGNCDPSEAPTICAADNSEGVLVAHENCNQFYICNGGKPVAMSCPGNLLFNPNTDQCDWPHNVDCGDRVIPDPEDSNNESGDDSGNDVVRPPVDDGTCNCNPEEAPSICAGEDSSGILVAHENCNQFYKCDHGKPVVLSCPGNLLYNPYTERCDWPENVDCGDRGISDPENDDSDNTSGGNNDGGNEGGGNEGGGNEGGGNCNPSEAPTICAADDSEGVLVAHENCNQFYICNGGKPVVMSCPGNLLFNPNTDQCDWPHNVDCGDRVIPDPEDSNNESSDDSGDLPPGGDDIVRPPVDDGTCNCNPEEAPSICAGDNSDGTLVAHENCNQFYKCDHGKPVALSCPGNLLYNPYTEQCDWPENVDCGDRVISEPEDDNNSNNSGGNDGGGNEGGGNEGGGNEGGGNCDPSEAPTICAADDSDGVLVAHENCNQFYKCSEGKPVAMSCPGNLLFNPNTDQCDWPHNVDCGDRVISDPEDSDNDSSADIDDFPQGDDDSNTNPETNPEDNNSANDSNDSECTDNENDGTCNCDPDQAPAICAVGNSDGVLIAHENCNQFYKCDNGQAIPFKCPLNLLYNPHTGVCDWPSNVECGDRIIPDPEDNNENNSGESQESEDNDNVGPCNCNPEEAPAICAADGSNGVQIAHENCNQFYMCDHGTPVAFTCNGFLLYNPYTKQCDWPANVECGDRVIPELGEDNDDNNNDVDDNNNNAVHDDPSQAPSICASTGSEGVLVAHENCDQYYICSGGVPVSQACSGGLLFNPLARYCDWPQNVVCGDRIVPDGDCACNPRNAPSLCARQDSEGKLVAHENCNQFYLCVHSVPVALICPNGLYYNIDKEMCDWPENVNCENRLLSYISLNKHMQSRQTLRK